jgi:hypothetical protein
MTAEIRRRDPRAIHTSLKEAVAAALVNITHARISGAGSYGELIYGTRPRNTLASGFILPMRGTEEGDEVTSPIWISSHGLDFQIGVAQAGPIRIQPYFSIYVRVLPTARDLRRPDCEPRFRLKSEVSRALQLKIREELDARWEALKDRYKSRRDVPDWDDIRQAVREQIYNDAGVPTDLSEVSVQDVDVEKESKDVDPTLSIAAERRHKVINDDLFEPLRIPQKWRRLTPAVPPLEFDPNAEPAAIAAAVEGHRSLMRRAIAETLSAWMADTNPETGGALWAFREDEHIRPSDYRDWSDALEKIRQRANRPVLPLALDPSIDVQVLRDWRDPQRRSVHIALENRSEEPRIHVDHSELGLFQVSLEVEMPESTHRPIKLERVEPSYRYNEYLSYPAIGFNGGISCTSADGLTRLTTNWAPRYAQPRLEPTAPQGISLLMEDLALPEGFDSIRGISEEYRQWLRGLPNQVDVAAGISDDRAAVEREKEKLKNDLQMWQREIAYIDAGLEILSQSRMHWKERGPQADERAVPFEAWLAMNETMASVLRAKLDGRRGSWRLFQIAFVLANLPAVATRIDAYKHLYVPERDDAVSLLYFATGGGKSEAFFGLLTFTLLMDRLRGKEIGVTAMIRYPLRLLTIQQAQRAASVLAYAERVRCLRQYGGKPLSIGFWVGSGGSPNRLSSPGVSDVPTIDKVDAQRDAENTLRKKSARYESVRKAWLKLPRCPFCQAETCLRRFPKLGGTLGHVCMDSKCISNEGGFAPLPFYIVDEDIYDLAPSVVLGTVDKLALIGHSPRTIKKILGMMGCAIWQRKSDGRLVVPDPAQLASPDFERYEPLAPAYPAGKKLFKDPFPALLIQDEAHLLDESLGTFAGLFESTLDAMLSEVALGLSGRIALTPSGERRRAKVIAASATVSEPDRQLEHLYQRNSPAIQFPYPGPHLYWSFYARPVSPDPEERERGALSDIEQRSVQARLYAAFMTNGRPHTVTTVAVLVAFHLTISETWEWLNSDDSRSRVREILCEFASAGPLQELHMSRIRSSTDDELATLLDLHRIALTYVTNKKGGDQIMAAEGEESRKRHLERGLNVQQLATKLITGSVDQGEIQNVVDIAKQRPSVGEPFPPLADALRSIIATSAVSHGVDVDEFNSMFFAGMPSDIAEYIQASSRVGRTHLGFCVLIPTPQRRRDRYIIEVFDVFHRFLERMVLPAAIDRWAERAVERVLPSVFQAYVSGVIPTRELLQEPPEKKAFVPAMDSAPHVLGRWIGREEAFIKEVTSFMGRAIGLSPQYRPTGFEYYERLLEERLRKRLIQALDERGYREGSLQSFFRNQTDPMMKPMTSLRDVDQGGLIHLGMKDYRGNRLNADDVVDVMAFIRLGTAEAGDGAADE